MFVLDTNVVSEIVKPAPDPHVARWIAATPADVCHLAAPSVAEILFGLHVMPEGARRARIASAVTRFMERLEILPFDREAAAFYALIAAGRRSQGRPISPFDAQIAAIARAQSFSVVTRDASGFEDCGVEIIDPWAGG